METFEGRLYSIAADGSDLLVLSDEQEDVHAFTFLPGDQGILYVDTSGPILAGSPYLKITDLEGNCRHLDPPVLEIWGVALSPNGNKIALDTHHGLLIADTSLVLGPDIWAQGVPCDSYIEHEQ